MYRFAINTSFTIIYALNVEVELLILIVYGSFLVLLVNEMNQPNCEQSTYYNNVNCEQSTEYNNVNCEQSTYYNNVNCEQSP